MLKEVEATIKDMGRNKSLDMDSQLNSSQHFGKLQDKNFLRSSMNSSTLGNCKGLEYNIPSSYTKCGRCQKLQELQAQQPMQHGVQNYDENNSKQVKSHPPYDHIP